MDYSMPPGSARNSLISPIFEAWRAWLSRHFDMVSKGAESVHYAGAKNPLSQGTREGTNWG